MDRLGDLELCAAFAVLEGIGDDVAEFRGELAFFEDDGPLQVMPTGIYNPLTDLSLIAGAMFKYRVNIRHCAWDDVPFVVAWVKTSAGDFEGMTPFDQVLPADISRAVLECILRSEGVTV